MLITNTPNSELHIYNNDGKELVTITPEKTTVSNFEGGNPNRVQVIYGTMFNPFGTGQIDIMGLKEALKNNDATVFLEGDASGIGFMEFWSNINWSHDWFYASSGFDNPNDHTYTGFVGRWDIYHVGDDYPVEINSLSVWDNGEYTNAYSYADQIPTKLTVIWHPIPLGAVSTEQIKGTVSNPFGDGALFHKLLDGLSSGNASAEIIADASALGQGTIRGQLGAYNEYIRIEGCSLGSSIANSEAYEVGYNEHGLVDYSMLMNGEVVDLMEYADQIPTILNITWHPVPANNYAHNL